MGKR
jgi:hypothetical protein